MVILYNYIYINCLIQWPCRLFGAHSNSCGSMQLSLERMNPEGDQDKGLQVSCIYNRMCSLTRLRQDPAWKVSHGLNKYFCKWEGCLGRTVNYSWLPWPERTVVQQQAQRWRYKKPNVAVRLAKKKKKKAPPCSLVSSGSGHISTFCLLWSICLCRLSVMCHLW